MKHLTTLLIEAIALISCNNQTQNNMTKSENEKIVRQYFDYFNKHDWDKMSGLYVEVSDFKDPSLGHGIVKQTRQQIIEKYSGLSKMFPDVKYEVIQIYPSGDTHLMVELF